MAGLMQWFQVTCPSCANQLQVKLPEGVTSVQCSQCKAVFAVQVQPVALVPAALACSLIDVDAAKTMPSTAPVTKSLMPNRGLKPASGNQHGLKPASGTVYSLRATTGYA